MCYNTHTGPVWWDHTEGRRADHGARSTRNDVLDAICPSKTYGNARCGLQMSIRLIYCLPIPVSMTIAMSEFIILIGFGIAYLAALVAYNTLGKKSE